MRFVSLTVRNFRAIKFIELRNLQDMVVIAGPNGCGKSCVLDSLRLLKSVYGGYQPNEWQQWLGEFQINQRDPRQVVSLLRDRTAPATIRAEIQLDADEVIFIRENMRRLLEPLAWKTVVPGMRENRRFSPVALAAELRTYKPVVDQRIQELVPTVTSLLDHNTLVGELAIDSQGNILTVNNVLLELVFSSFQPRHIGLVDLDLPRFHGRLVVGVDGV